MVGTAGAAPAGYLYEVDHAIIASPDGARDNAIMTLLVYNTSGTNGNNVMYVGSNCQADFDDILINDSTDTVTYPHRINWSASDGNHVTIEYNITTGVPLGGTTVKIYYGYPAANNHESANGVYALFDEFTGGAIDGALWTDGTAGHSTVSGGIITITANDASYRTITSKAGFGLNVTVEASVKNYHTGAYVERIRLSYGHMESCNYDATQYQTSNAGGNNFVSITGWSTGAYHIQKITRRGAAAVDFRVDGGNLVTSSTYVSTETPQNVLLVTSGAASSISMDWIKVYPYYAGAAPTDGSWGTPNSDILQTVPFTLYKIDVLGLSIGPVSGAVVSVTDVNGNAVRSGTTGTDGTASFQLYRNTYYNLHFVKVAEGVDKTWGGYPSNLDGYIVYVYPWEFVWTNTSEGRSDVNTKLITFVDVAANGTAGDITAYYNDTGATSTTVTINVYKRNNATNDTLIATYTEAGNSDFNHKFTIAGVSGQDYKVVITATSTKYGTVIRSYPWRFPGPKYPVAGLPAMAYTWIGFIIPTFIALTASYRNLKFAPVIFCACSWIFVILGWMDQMGPLYEVGLTVATVFSVIFIFKMKQQEGY